VVRWLAASASRRNPVGSAADRVRHVACGVVPRSSLWLWSSESKAVKSAGVLGRAGVRGTAQPGTLKFDVCDRRLGRLRCWCRHRAVE
jgi:hypothetical protein